MGEVGRAAAPSACRASLRRRQPSGNVGGEDGSEAAGVAVIARGASVVQALDQAAPVRGIAVGRAISTCPIVRTAPGPIDCAANSGRAGSRCCPPT